MHIRVFVSQGLLPHPRGQQALQASGAQRCVFSRFLTMLSFPVTQMCVFFASVHKAVPEFLPEGKGPLVDKPTGGASLQQRDS